LSVYFSRYFFIVLFFLSLAVKTSAQGVKFLIPDAAIVQFAGSIGYFSAGAGYDIFKNKRGNIDFNYGYVPKSKGGELHIVTAKFAYRPFQIRLKDWGKFYPFNPGVFFSYTFHKDLSWRFDPDLYPGNYYYWSEAFRPHISFTNELELKADKLLKGTGIKTLSVYSEFNSNDYYLVNYFQNMSELTLSDVFQLGIGLRVKF